MSERIHQRISPDQAITENNRELIGLCLSFCIGDLFSGEVGLERVREIRPNFDWETPDQIREVVFDYLERGYWADHTEEDKARIQALVDQLMEEGKITHRRSTGPHPRVWMVAS